MSPVETLKVSLRTSHHEADDADQLIRVQAGRPDSKVQVCASVPDRTPCRSQGRRDVGTDEVICLLVLLTRDLLTTVVLYRGTPLGKPLIQTVSTVFTYYLPQLQILYVFIRTSSDLSSAPTVVNSTDTNEL